MKRLCKSLNLARRTINMPQLTKSFCCREFYLAIEKTKNFQIKKLALYCLVLFLFPLTGCPLLTKIPIDGGSCEVQPWMRGRWHEVNELGKPEKAWLLERDLQKGNLTIYEIDSEGKPNYAKPGKVIMSNLGGKTFACINNIGDDGTDEGYYIYEFRKISNKEFTLAGIKANKIPYITSIFDLLKFLKDNMNNPNIYDPHETMTYKKYYSVSNYSFD